MLFMETAFIPQANMQTHLTRDTCVLYHCGKLFRRDSRLHIDDFNSNSNSTFATDRRTLNFWKNFRPATTQATISHEGAQSIWYIFHVCLHTHADNDPRIQKKRFERALFATTFTYVEWKDGNIFFANCFCHFFRIVYAL
jgi:hypothetical protein